ncbi:MAG: hypothetical protein NVSMB27_25030 [Ktedonobacteraceae bacterium]
MNCEHVEELLSAYLDDSLTLGETAQSAFQLRLEIAAHVRECIHCSTILADYRRFDTLLAQMPRISPSPALRDRIFSSPEYLELTGTYDSDASVTSKEQTAPYKSVRRDTPGRPQLVALPGGRHTSPGLSTRLKLPPLEQQRPPVRPQRDMWGLRILQVAIAAMLLLTLGVGSLIGWDLWQQSTHPAVSTKGITPPAGPALRGPLSAGMRFVFLRDGLLWSTPADGSSQAEQLTPKGITVAADWVVSPPLPGRDAGDMVAYIDLQQALIHTIRSDGQSDEVVRQPLLKVGIAPTSVWDTNVGEAILTSLAWSSDGSMLAFVADPTNAGTTNLYILSTATGTVQMVSLPLKGSIAHPIWSPDGIRVAFELTHNGVVTILDYNTQNHGVLVITDNVNAGGKDTVLTLDWSPDTDAPTITWSVGVIGHVHSLWSRRVGNGGNASPQEITQGDYVQAIYSRAGHGGVGSWLLVSSYMGRPANLWRIDVTPGAFPVVLTSGKQVNFAQWSPDGTQIDYLDSISSGVGTLRVVNVITVIDTFIRQGVTNVPAPAWSLDGKKLVYSTSSATVVANMQQGSLQLHVLKLRGRASTFTWSTSSSQQLVVALSDGQPGTYLLDTQHNTLLQADQQDITGPILWTEIP